MFWIGFCVGISCCFLICLVGLSAMSWSIGKERKVAAEKPAIPPELVKYWETCNKSIEAQYIRLGEILDKLATR